MVRYWKSQQTQLDLYILVLLNVDFIQNDSTIFIWTHYEINCLIQLTLYFAEYLL